MSKVKVIATIGPGSNKPDILKKLQNREVDFFRINLSHTGINFIEEKINDIRGYNIPIILDTEGSQVRSGNTDIIYFDKGDTIKVHKTKIRYNKSNLTLNPLDIINNLRESDLISIDFNSLLLKVYDTSNLSAKGYIECKVIIGGEIGGKKAVHIESPTFSLPTFSKKDKVAIELAKKYNVKHFTLSFMESKEEVKEFKSLFPECTIYSKIESRKGLDNFLEIVQESDGVLIDRGDLSSQIALEKIPLIQKYIINKCKELNKVAIVATNTLEQMSFSLKPNHITFLWFSTGILGSFLLWPGKLSYAIVFLLAYMFTWYLDFIDGDMARIIHYVYPDFKQNIYATWLDKFAYSTHKSVTLLGMGVFSYRFTGQLHFVFIGFAASYILILDNLMKLRVTEALLNKSKIEKGKEHIEYLSENSFIKKYLLPFIRPEPVSILTFAIVFSFIHWLLYFYLILYSLYLIKSFLVITKKLSTVYR